MKKLVTAACALAAGMAMATGVESANTVGYTTQAITADQWYMVGIQFKNVGSGTAAISVNDLIQLSGVTACRWSQRRTKAPQIQYYNGSGYDFFYYVSDASLPPPDDEEDVGEDCWADGGFLATDAKALGEGFWITFPADSVGANASFAVKGEVKEAQPTTVNFTADTWKIISNPFPVATDLSKVITSGVTACKWSKRRTDAAQIQYYNGSGYDFFYYVNDASLPPPDDEEDVGHDCWADGGFIATGDRIPAGAAFWIKSPQNGSLTFSL